MNTLQTTRLQELEKTIEGGLQTFVEVGKALMEIRDSRLYLDTHGTFEEYVKARWGWTRDWAYKQIAAAQVIGNVDSSIHLPVTHARELATLEPDEQRELAPLIAPLTVREAREVINLHKQGMVNCKACGNIFTYAALEQVGECPYCTRTPEERANGLREHEKSEKDSRLAVHYSSATDDWSTPQNLFDVLNKEFSFSLDVCASAENAKAARHFSEQEDGLSQVWDGVCWMNPPYGDVIPVWVQKAFESAESGATVVCLLPARVDTGWWWNYCRFGEIRFMRGRLRFGNAESGAPFPSAVVIFPRDACVRWWEWQKELPVKDSTSI